MNITIVNVNSDEQQLNKIENDKVNENNCSLLSILHYMIAL